MDLVQLLNDIRNSIGPNRWVDSNIEILMNPGLSGYHIYQPKIGRFYIRETEEIEGYAGPYSTSIDECVSAIRNLLPDFWYCSGHCSLSGHASLGPDYNGPARERLLAEWPEDLFDQGFHEDLNLGEGPHRQCLALLSCLVQALIAMRHEYPCVVCVDARARQDVPDQGEPLPEGWIWRRSGNFWCPVRAAHAEEDLAKTCETIRKQTEFATCPPHLDPTYDEHERAQALAGTAPATDPEKFRARVESDDMEGPSFVLPANSARQEIER